MDFLNVTTPLADIYDPKSNKSNANFFEPVKQCIRILKSFSAFFFLSKSSVSFSAFLVCTIKGNFVSWAAVICSSKHLSDLFFQNDCSKNLDHFPYTYNFIINPYFSIISLLFIVL